MSAVYTECLKSITSNDISVFMAPVGYYNTIPFGPAFHVWCIRFTTGYIIRVIPSQNSQETIQEFALIFQGTFSLIHQGFVRREIASHIIGTVFHLINAEALNKS